jgi:hypothetical protein
MLKKTVFTLAAFASLIMANPASAGNWEFMDVNKLNFAYSSFSIQIKSLVYCSAFLKDYGEEKAEDGSVFVVLVMNVKNNTGEGQTFSPSEHVIVRTCAARNASKIRKPDNKPIIALFVSHCKSAQSLANRL